MSSRFLPSLRGPLPLALLLAAVPALHASTLTYNLTLSPISGMQGGTGTLTLAAPPASSGTTTYSIANQQLQDLSFTIDGQNFYLSGDPSATVQFTNGQLSSINFIQTVDHPPARYTLELSTGYSFYGNDFGHPVSAGSLGATPAAITPEEVTGDAAQPEQPASPTPEPGTLVLLATALAAGGFLILRRKRTAHS
ncbi:MAG TPA: PEP-CTERM sorting domain-containing protein [Acidobacteriaceae bacterium]|nr:PEP-CTERM sorting domain-containing protein [Acidobacteriaceae bacterium]